MALNNITKESLSHHRVINSSTGAVGVVDDGINVEIAIVTGTEFAAERNDDDREGVVEFIDGVERKES